MSIIAYTGLPGSGKSYNAVANVILPALKADRKVVTNIPLVEDRIRKLTPLGEIVEFPVQLVQQEPDRIKEFVAPGVVWVLDEVWRLFPQGQKSDKVPEAYRSLLAEHRHMVDAAGNSVSIVFVVQDLANIGAFARRMVESTFHHTKLSFVGANRRFRVDVYHGQVTGATPGVSNRLRELYGSYEPKITALYQSHTMSQSETAGANEKHVDQRANILRRPIFLLAPPILLLLGWWGWHTLSGLYHKAGGGSPAAVVAAAVGGGASPQGLSAPQAVGGSAPRPPSPPSSSWRLIGTLQSQLHPERDVGVLSDGKHVLRVPLGECRIVDVYHWFCPYSGTWWGEGGASLNL